MPNLSEAVVRDTGHGVVAIDQRQIIVSFSSAAEQMFGYAAEEVLGQELDVLLPLSFRGKHQQYVERVMETGDAVREMGRNGRIQGLRKNGETFALEATLMRLDLAQEPILVAVLSDLTEAEGRERENRWLTELLRATTDFVGIADVDGHVLFHNAAADRMLGLEPGELAAEGRRVEQGHPEPTREWLRKEAFPTAARAGYWQGESLFLNKDGEEIPVSQELIAHYDEDGEVVRWSTIARDLRPYRRLESHGQRLSHALEQIDDLVWIIDSDGRFEYANRPFYRVTGYSEDHLHEADAFALFELVPEAIEGLKSLRHAVLTGRGFRALLKLTQTSSDVFIEATVGPVIDDSGQFEHCVVIGRDVTSRVQREQRLHKLAYQDRVSGLYSRSYAVEYLQQALQEDNVRLVVAFIDLDRFKQVNDAFGHETGDSLLALVGARLMRTVRDNDMVARFGGDEFLFIGRLRDETKGSQRIAQKLLDALSSPFYLAGEQFHLGASIGVSTHPAHGDSGDALIRQADEAMYQAKDAGGGYCLATMNPGREAPVSSTPGGTRL
jgi:diguanylate cyclase (GGDEF)-like protein/PAS domain S-box-containing protein